MNAVVGRSTLRQWEMSGWIPAFAGMTSWKVGPPTFHSAASFDYPLDPRQHFMVYPRHWNGFGLSSPERWAYSSAGEHYVDIVGVTSSILVTPTISPHASRFPGLGDFRASGWTRSAKRVRVRAQTMGRVHSSAGEHYLHTVGVTGSIPVAPTIGSQRQPCTAPTEHRDCSPSFIARSAR